MTVSFEVTVSDEEAKALEEFSDARIEEELVESLRRLAGIEQMRDELKNRLDIPSGDGSDEGEELAADEAMRRKLKEQRRSGANR